MVININHHPDWIFQVFLLSNKCKFVGCLSDPQGQTGSLVSRLSPVTYYINGYYNIMDQYLTSFNLDAVFFCMSVLE